MDIPTYVQYNVHRKYICRRHFIFYWSKSGCATIAAKGDKYIEWQEEDIALRKKARCYASSKKFKKKDVDLKFQGIQDGGLTSQSLGISQDFGRNCREIAALAHLVVFLTFTQTATKTSFPYNYQMEVLSDLVISLIYKHIHDMANKL